ncbi:hydrogenase maturation protein HypF [Enhydrobacter aerosaccus]|uniref:Carbamoyltransferase HypF n=1 Tax=Enhydrobacter aerosaccus TaxID=225324 RepID=A0A1T4T367_9HYPH|nr:carbamoyltransferase HypF [Enhydrobacter aerosaccus]SKA34964.1 hydrogenase maturation protein HypF [Enhydrobacter aerosaccus]
MALVTGIRRRQRIEVHGAVQGVGFRPFVYRQATALGLTGWVANSMAGLTVEAEGDATDVATLIDVLQQPPLPNTRIAGISVCDVALRGDAGFSVRASETLGACAAQIQPDIATCPACLAELFDPANRRHRYPFINCTQCGPRYSIVEDLPYDRVRTSMRHFTMCPACQAEYDNPADRRFHAEPNACPVCGPRLSLWNDQGAPLAQDEQALQTAVAAIHAGKIVAVKGIGGFHLMVDARNDDAVRRLRVGKRRPEKPFAVMFPDLGDVRASCRVDAEAEVLLAGAARPIVLLAHEGGPIAPSVAPDSRRLGAMLPYSPLHHLLMAELRFPVVATSGNVSDEPIVTEEASAPERLSGLADLFLVHDRPIVRPLDDSVAQIVCGRPQLLRRARGYAPEALAAKNVGDGILALGGHLKSAVALSTRAGILVSQHLGDLETSRAREGFRQALAEVTHLTRQHPRLVARDLHPDYASSRAADASGVPVVAVQHHVAHIAACLGEHGLEPPALGVAWDGTGYGPDGTVWGGEFIHLTKGRWHRVASLRPFRLSGGDAAAREPRRSALGLLYAAFGEKAFSMTDLPPVATYTAAELAILGTAMARGINAPSTSSVGRLFDAFASLCDLQQRTSYEGQAAQRFEALTGGGIPYDLPIRAGADAAAPFLVDWHPALEAMLADRHKPADPSAVSAALHGGLVRAIVEVARQVGEHRVVLTGGCFQNVRLTEAAVSALQEAGFTPLWHQRIPPNDGGIALGQVAWTGWLEAKGTSSCA